MSLVVFVDFVLAFLVAETLVLLAWRVATRRGLAVGAVLPMMAAGGFILLALHQVLHGAPAIVIVACLAAAGIAHVWDLRRRWAARS